MYAEFRYEQVEGGWRWQAFRRDGDKELVAESLTLFASEAEAMQFVKGCQAGVNQFVNEARHAPAGTADIRFHYGRS